MSRFQRVKNTFAAVIMILFAILLLLVPEEGYSVIAVIISFSLLVIGIRQMWFYFTMSRHMVGGKMTLYLSIIILDMSLLSVSLVSISSVYIVLYLLVIYAFYGAIDILRAFEAKRYGSPSWKFRLISGAAKLITVPAFIVAGLVLNTPLIPVWGYAASLIYSAVMRIISSLRRTAIVYIQ